MFLLPGNAVNRSAPLNRGLVSWWVALPNRLGGGGNTLRDLNGTNHGTLKSGPTWSGASHAGGSGSINFGSGYIDIPPIGLGSSLTYSAWINPSTVSGNKAIISNKSTMLELNSANLRWFPNTATTVVSAGVSLSAGAWRHVAIAHDSSNNYTFYLDGLSVATGSTVAISNTAESSDIGRYGADGTRLFTGFMDSICVCNRALSGAEVMSLYQSSRRGYPNELNWQRYPVYGAQQAAATFSPAWAINSNAYIHLGV